MFIGWRHGKRERERERDIEIFKSPVQTAGDAKSLFIE